LFLVRGIALIFQHRDALTHPPLCFGGHDIGMREIQNAANLKKGASEEKKIHILNSHIQITPHGSLSS